MIKRESYNLMLMTALYPNSTGIENVVIYADTPDASLDERDEDPYYVKVSIGKRWGATNKLFCMGIKGDTKGKWMRVLGSDYLNEKDVPTDLLLAIRAFVTLNADVLVEWVDYEDIELDSFHFSKLIKSI